MKGRSPTDPIFAMRQLQDEFREGQNELHSVFIDLKKAYDRVPNVTSAWAGKEFQRNISAW